MKTSYSSDPKIKISREYVVEYYLAINYDCVFHQSLLIAINQQLKAIKDNNFLSNKNIVYKLMTSIRNCRYRVSFAVL